MSQPDKLICRHLSLNELPEAAEITLTTGELFAGMGIDRTVKICPLCLGILYGQLRLTVQGWVPGPEAPKSVP
jgi:hypothetical protein